MLLSFFFFISPKYKHWLAMPEMMHVGSLIVDDIQDKSEIRRGGPACHIMHGDAIAINGQHTHNQIHKIAALASIAIAVAKRRTQNQNAEQQRWTMRLNAHFLCSLVSLAFVLLFLSLSSRNCCLFPVSAHPSIFDS